MIQIQLKPDIEAQLKSEAQARGLELDQYIAEIVESRDPAIETAQKERRTAVEGNA